MFSRALDFGVEQNVQDLGFYPGFQGFILDTNCGSNVSDRTIPTPSLGRQSSLLGSLSGILGSVWGAHRENP